jgi:hypothetical protein
VACLQRGEVGNAVGVEHDRLAVDHEMLLTQLVRGLDDQREVPCLVVAVPADQAHAVPLADEHHPASVVFHLVQPVGAGRHRDRF